MTALSRMLRKARSAVLRRGVPDQDADDLVQEAFLRLEGYERAHEVRSREAFLVNAAANLTIDRSRRAAARVVHDSSPETLDAIALEAPAADEVMVSRQRLARLREGIAALPERTQRVLLARRLDNLSFGEIADREGLSVSAVEKQVARATLTLMRWMDEW